MFSIGVDCGRKAGFSESGPSKILQSISHRVERRVTPALAGFGAIHMLGTIPTLFMRFHVKDSFAYGVHVN